MFYGVNGGILISNMPYLVDKFVDLQAENLAKPLQEQEPAYKIALKAGMAKTYARQVNQYQNTEAYLKRLPELNRIALARKVKLEQIADKYAKKKAKDAKFSELASASASYRKDIQLLTGGATGNVQVIQWEE